jgi:galactose mutarotase-like enzyme
LGDKAFDDGYDQVADDSVFAVSGGGRRVEVHFEEGYPAAQIFAPLGEDIVCFEPMAAPTDALRRGGYRSAQPGDWGVAQFSIRV